MLSVTTGTLVAATAKPYDFVDSRTAERKTGTSYRLYIVKDFGEEPIKAKCNADQYAAAAGYGMGANVEVMLEARAENNRLAFSVTGLTVVSKNGAKVPA